MRRNGVTVIVYLREDLLESFMAGNKMVINFLCTRAALLKIQK